MVWYSWNCFLLEVPNGPCQVKVPIDPPFNYSSTAFYDSLFLPFEGWFVVFWKRDRLIVLHECRSGISGIRNVNLFRGNQDNIGCAPGHQVFLGDLLVLCGCWFVDYLLGNSLLASQLEVYLKECFFECIGILFLLKTLSFEQLLDKVIGRVLRYFWSAMAVKDCKNRYARMRWDFQLCNHSVFHVLPPSLHLAAGPSEVGVGARMDIFGGDRLG